MPAAESLVTTFTVKSNGQDLADDQARLITAIDVELNLHQPDACAVMFHDVDMALSATDIIPIGTELEVFLGSGDVANRVFIGEVTSQTIDVQERGSGALIVRAFDRTHRLQRGRFSRAFLNMTDSDIVTKIARENGLQPQCDATPQVHEYILQNNQSNWEFILDRARRNGFEVFVQDTTISFRKPAVEDAPVLSADFWDDVMRTHLHVSSVAQVKEVTVRAWDVAAQQAIIGRATRGAATARGGQQKQGGDISRPFGDATMVVTRYPVGSQAEADTIAQALADDLAGDALYLELEIMGSPDLRPGRSLDLSDLSDRFSGQYYISAVRHRYHMQRGYSTNVTVQGRRSGTLLEAVAIASEPGDTHGLGTAVAVGVVTNNKDEQGLGRVKVRLPWLTDDEADWARLVATGAGDGRGIYWLPEVNDEVLVACEQGDTSRLYVLGPLWNPKAKPPKDNASVIDGQGQVTQRIIKSRSGHTITLDDTTGDGSITIVDSSGNNSITIETSSNKITIAAQGDLELTAGGAVKVSGSSVSVEAETNCEIKATGSATLSGGTLSVEAQATCDIKGAMINLN
jgi:phage protein D/phage baseplate assembly protein gpV